MREGGPWAKYSNWILLANQLCKASLPQLRHQLVDSPDLISLLSVPAIRAVP
jgi:hypothetical protein